MKTAYSCVLIVSAGLFACVAGPGSPEPATVLGPSVPPDSPPEARLLAVAWDTGATPVYPGASVEFLPWHPPPTVFARVLDDSAVQAVEFWVGPRKAAEVTPSTSMVTFAVEEAPPYPTVVSLRVVARDDSGQETEDTEDLLLLPATYSSSQVVRTDWRLVVDGPDSWTPSCGQVRVRARLVHEEPGNPFEFLDAVTWTVLLDGQAVATSDGEELDQVVDLSSVGGGPQPLLVWVGLHAVNALDGTETSWSLAREVGLDVTSGKSCEPPPCSVRVAGLDQGEVVETVPGIVFAEVDPDSEGTRVEFHVDGTLVWTDSVAPHVAPLPDLGDGRHVLKVVAKPPAGGECEDRVGFTKDATPPVLSVGPIVSDPSRCFPRVTLRVQDTTRVELDPARTPDAPPTADESGTLGIPVWADPDTAWTVTARDQVGHASPLSVEIPHDARPPWEVRAVFPDRAWGTSLVGLAWEDCAPPESLDLAAFVDGAPAAAAGLVLGGVEDIRDLGWSFLLPGRWDTTTVPDGPHEVLLLGVMDGVPFEVRAQVTVQNSAMTGEELQLSECDPDFSSCGPVRTGRVSGPVGVLAEVPWYDLEAPPPVITIRAADAVVAQCEDRRCAWVLDFEAAGIQSALVSATADFQEVGVRLGASETWTLVEDDLDGDGFPAIADGGDDCDDQDPFVHPGAPDPEGPECARAGFPNETVVAVGAGVGSALSAFRTADGALHVVHCVASSHVFEWVTLGGTEPVARALDPGVPSCGAATSQVAFDPQGTPWVLLDEPGADPRFVLTYLQGDSLAVEPLPIRADLEAHAALTVPAEDSPLILVAYGFYGNMELRLWRRDHGAWTEQPLAKYPGWPAQGLDAVSAMGATRAGTAVVQMGVAPLEVWSFDAAGNGTATPVAWDLHDEAVATSHHDRLPFMPQYFEVNVASTVTFWSLRGATWGRAGEPVIVLTRDGIPYLVRAAGAGARVWFLPADFPDPSGRPTWSLDPTLDVSVGAAATGSPFLAWVTDPCMNWGRSPWYDLPVCNRLEFAPALETQPVLRVARLHGSALERLEVPGDAAFERAEVVAGGTGAGEVVARTAGGGEVRLLSWPCEEWVEDDLDCDGGAR